MGKLDFVLKSDGPTGSIQGDADRVLTLLGEDPDLIVELESALLDYKYPREVAPLLLDGVVDLCKLHEDSSRKLESFLLSLPRYCHASELHTFALDSWIRIWNDSCECSGPEARCNLMRIRGTLAVMISDVIGRTTKGPLFRNKENFLLSAAGQFLSKFWIPESEDPIHFISDAWVESVLIICRNLHSLSIGCEAETQAAANLEICARLIAAVLACMFARPRNEQVTETILDYVVGNAPLLSMLNSKMVSLTPPLSMYISCGSRAADFELEPADVALFVWAGVMRKNMSPCVIPMIWSIGKRADVLVRSALCLLRTSTVLKPGLSLSIDILSDLEVVSVAIQRVSLTPEWLEELLTIATSFGDESFMSLTDRQNIFQTVSNCMTQCPMSAGARVCLEVVKRSHIDSVIGLFLKMLKDMWTTHASTNDLFHEAVKLVASSDYQIVDGIDTLKSILNWARLVYLKSPNLNNECDATFGGFLKEVISKIDLELELINTMTDEESEMKKTRLVFIGHLAARVREIMSGHSSACHHR